MSMVPTQYKEKSSNFVTVKRGNVRILFYFILFFGVGGYITINQLQLTYI